MFLLYILVRLLQYRQVVLFTVDGTRLFLFHTGEVYMVVTHLSLALPLPSWPSSKAFIWSLFDIKASKEPEELLIRYHCFCYDMAFQQVIIISFNLILSGGTYLIWKISSYP